MNSITAATVTLLFLAVGLLCAQQPNPQPLPAEHLQQKAEAARTNSPDAVKAFTEAIFERSIAPGIALSLKERVFRAELAFRGNAHLPIDESRLATAINGRVRGFHGPDYFLTTEGQIHLTREIARVHVRDFVDSHTPRRQPKEAPPDMSPAEAAFVTIHLVAQKLLNPEYRIPPDQWEKETRARFAAPRNNPPLTTGSVVANAVGRNAVATPLHQSVFGFLSDLQKEPSLSVDEAHRFLDDIGFSR